MIKNIIYKINIIVFLILILFITSSCSFKNLNDNAEIVVDNEGLNSIAFVLDDDNSCNEIKFITKIKEKGKIYIAEAKMYEGKIVYHNIIEDRNFRIIGAYEDTVYVLNESGIQKIVYSFPSIGFSSKIETDVIVSYKTDSFDKLIKPINDNHFVETPTTSENRLLDGISNENIYSIAYYYEQSEFGATRSKYLKSDVYTYFDDENTLNLYYKNYGYQMIKTISGTIREDLPEIVLDLKLFGQEIKVKTVKCAYYDNNVYLYIIDKNNTIYCYDIINNKMSNIDKYVTIKDVIIVGKHLAVLNQESIDILNYKLQMVDSIKIGNDILLSAAWYKSNTDKLIYGVLENNKIKLNIYEIKEETNNN